MMPFPNSPNTQKTAPARSLRWVCCAIACIAVTGCRQRAYTELYVENMASEVRMLEDRIWEYDAAYREKDAEYEWLKQQVATLKKKNAELAKKTTTKLEGSSLQMSPARPFSLRSNPSESVEFPPNDPSSIPGNRYEVPSVLTPETLESPPPIVSKTPVAPPQSNKGVTPSVEDLMPPGGNSSQSPPPIPENLKNPSEQPRASNGIRLPKKNSNLPDINSLNTEVAMPESMVRSAQQPRLMTAPEPQQDSLPNSNPSQNPSQPTTVPSLFPILQRRLPKINDGNPQGTIQGGKIRLPEGSKVQFASATEPIPLPNLKKVLDQRIVEIAFHPTMCRGHNFDDKPGDDGLYLVVTPINANAEVINQTGTLTVIVEDPAEPKESARIGAWEFTPEQLSELLEPVGTAQGFHLSLPWQSTLPKGKVVSVYLLFVDANGKKLPNQREVPLRVPTHEQQVWTPRKTATSK